MIQPERILGRLLFGTGDCFLSETGKECRRESLQAKLFNSLFRSCKESVNKGSNVWRIPPAARGAILVWQSASYVSDKSQSAIVWRLEYLEISRDVEKVFRNIPDNSILEVNCCLCPFSSNIIIVLNAFAKHDREVKYCYFHHTCHTQRRPWGLRSGYRSFRTISGKTWAQRSNCTLHHKAGLAEDQA